VAGQSPRMMNSDPDRTDKTPTCRRQVIFR
jgi:hypothetical protein